MEWQRWSLGYNERFVDDFTLALSNGKKVRVSQAPTMAKGAAADRTYDPGVTGSTVWDAGIVLAQYLTTPISNGPLASLFNAPVGVALELGSGTGLVSLAVGCTHVVRTLLMTDIAGMVPLLKKNLQLNKPAIRLGTRVAPCPLRWACEADVLAIAALQAPCQLVFGSDVVYSDSIAQGDLLLETLRRVSDAHTVAAFALHSMHQPERVSAFVELLQANYSHVHVVPLDEQPPDWRSEDVVVVVCVGIHPPEDNEAGAGPPEDNSDALDT